MSSDGLIQVIATTASTCTYGQMCFSATASFGAAAILLPVGGYCLHKAKREDPQWIPFAAFPAAFGLQQATEGILWLGIASSDQALVALASRGFLFFSHFFWLFWVPFSVFRLEPDPDRKRFLLVATIIGGIYGASLFLPILLFDGWLNVEIAHHSIRYEIRLIYDGFVHREILRGIYVAIIVGSLLACSVKQIKVFGVLIFISVITAFLYFDYAFTSVWCFFAALLSAYVLMIIRRDVGYGRQSGSYDSKLRRQ